MHTHLKFSRVFLPSLVALALSITAQVQAELNSWSISVGSSGTFSGTESINSVTMSGTHTTLGNGFLEMTVTASSGSNAPAVSSLKYGIELPGFALFARPILTNERKVVATAGSGVCPTATWTGLVTYYLWTGTAGTITDVSSATTPVMGVMSWNPFTNQATVSDLRNLTSYATLGGFASFNTAGSCSNGVITLTGAGDRGGNLYVSTDFSGVYVTNTNRALFLVPQATIPAASNLNGTYATWIMDASAHQNIDPARITISGGTSASGDELSDIATSTSNTARTWTMSSITINSPVNGAFTATVNLEGTGSRPCICSAYFRTKTIIFCAFEEPEVAGLPANFVMVSDSQAFAAGSLDSYRFNSSGKANEDFRGTSVADEAHAVVLQNDGKIVVGGYTTNTTENFALARYLPTGTLDTTFSSDGKIETTIIAGNNDRIQAVALQSDQKIVVAGYRVNADNDMVVARYTTAGVLDTTFNTTGSRVDTWSNNNEQFLAVAVDSNQKIVAGGYCRNGGNDDFCVFRYTTAGALDTTWSTDGKDNTNVAGAGADRAYAILIQSDGKVVSVGRDTNDGGVVRHTTAGVEDTTFSTDGEVTVTLSVASNNRFLGGALQTDQKIVGCGYIAATTDDMAFARLTTAGALDTTFNTTGMRTVTFNGNAERCQAVAIQTDGKILGVGYATNTDKDFGVVRLTSAGAIDTTFATNGYFTTTLAGGADDTHAVAIQSDGKIVGAGSGTNGSGNLDFVLFRLWP